MNYFTQTKEQVTQSFNTCDRAGLGDEQVLINAEKYGLNILSRDKPVTLIKRILTALIEPMMIMLLAAALITLGINITLAVTGGEPDFIECVGIFVAITICISITVVMEGKSAKAFEALTKINEALMVRVIRNGETRLVPQQELVAGDVVIIETGVRIPADGRLIESTSLEADESSLTGESHSVKKEHDVIFENNTTDIPLADRVNMLYSGSFITAGSGKMVITAVGAGTEFGKIASELSDSANFANSASSGKSMTPLQEKLAKMGKTIAIFGFSAAAIAFTAQLVIFINNGTASLATVSEAFITSVVLIVAAVPEGLPTIVAVSLAISVIKMSKQNALVKKMVACETIGCINVICTDKTGTLTENKMTVINEITNPQIIKNIAINSTAEVGIGNPTECALLEKVSDYKKIRASAEIINVIPFSSQEKIMTTVINENETEITYIKGSPERIITLCDDDSLNEEILSFQKKACRIIAFCHSTNGEAYELDGFAAITDPIREEVITAVANCKKAGIKVIMLTGDNITTAQAIAEQAGIEEVHARITPADKLRLVRELKEAGHVVAVTGDGINDAPAIKNADVGIAMGITGTEVSKEAADIVLLDDSFATIAKAVKWGRGIYENFQRFIVYQLTVNLSTVIVVLVSILLGLGAPFTALQLLWINILMDGPPALALGLEPIRNDLMKRLPTKRTAPIITGAMISRIIIMSVFIVSVVLSQRLFNPLGATAENMSTVFFALFATFKLLNALNSRELGNVSIFKSFLSNKFVLVSLGIAFVAQFLIIQYGGAFFKTVPLSLDMWLKIFAVGISVIVVSELFRVVRKVLSIDS